VLTVAVKLAAARQGEGLGDLVHEMAPDELSAARDLREFIFTYHREVEAITTGVDTLPASELVLRVREARLLLLELFGEGHYGGLRALDRYRLQRLRSEVGSWLDGSWEDLDRARTTLGELGALFDGLSGINRRGKLLQHDRQVIEAARRILRDLAANPTLSHDERWRQYESLLDEIRTIRHRNSALELFVSRERRRGRSSVLRFADRCEAALAQLEKLEV
jgi:hypothetical protein